MGKLMKRKFTYKKMSSLDIAKILLLFLAFSQTLNIVWQLQEKEIYRVYQSLIGIFVFLALFCSIDILKIVSFMKKGNYDAVEKYLRKQLRQKERKEQLTLKEFREYIKLHMEVLLTDLLLGRYDGYLQEREKLLSLENHLTDMQKLRLQIGNIDYMISVNEIESEFLKQELKRAEEELEQFNGVSVTEKKRAEESIRLGRYLVEERWEDALEVMKTFSGSLKRDGILRMVIAAYIRGKCYYKLGSFGKAYAELRFAARWGSDTKYAAEANHMLEIMPGKDQYKKEHNRNTDRIKSEVLRKVIFLAVNCFLIVLFIVASGSCSYGSSMEEVYRKRYLCAEGEPVILYTEKVGDYEMAIMEEQGKTIYGLFQRTTDSGYRIKKFKFFSNNIGEDTFDKIEIAEEQKELFLKTSIEWEVQGIIMEFYKKYDVFYEEEAECVGISYSPMVEDVTVNGMPLSTEKMIGLDGRTGYLWRIELDLEEDIRVAYMGK